MCGRFAVTLPPDAMAQLFAAVPSNDLPAVPNHNACPTNRVHVVHSAEGTRRLVAMRWGFIPRWYKTPGDGPLLINARAETIAEKPAFREACRARRCILPADSFYEWTLTPDKERLPWNIQRRDGAPLALAGVWQEWSGEGTGETLATCAIVTTEAAGPMTSIHHRMPVILEAADWAKWLGEDGVGAARLMRAAEPQVLEFWRVDKAVNSNRAIGPFARLDAG